MLQLNFSKLWVQQKTPKQPNIVKCWISVLLLQGTKFGKTSKKSKPFLKLCTNENDERFSWMTNKFLSYLNTWRENTENRPDDFTQNTRSKIFVVWKHIMGYKSL